MNEVEYINKLIEENRMLKSNEFLNNKSIKDLKKKHEKEINEKNKEIRNLKERLSNLESKQIDIFEV